MKITALFRRLAACLLLNAAPAVAQEISISDSSGSEDAGPLTVVFTVQLSAIQALPVSFDFTLTDGSAVATAPGFPGDYVIPAMLSDSIPAGSLSKTVTITIEPESLQELAETFTINLSSTDATVAVGSATGTITESDIPVLGWDPGTVDAGTVFFNRPAGSTSPFFMRMNPQAATHGWRSRLTFGAGEAALSMAQGVLPDASALFQSALPGPDGFVVRPDQFHAGDPWYLRVDFAGTPTWTVVSGEVFITNLGALPFTDANANLAYDIGETVAPAPGGTVTVGPEGMRFFTVRIPAGTPGASLALVADLRGLTVRKTGVPFHDPPWMYDHRQPGHMLLVPPYLGGSEEAVFLSVMGVPGDAISLDARIQTVTPLAFNVATGAVTVPAGPPYRVFRVDVPPNTIAWDAALTPVAGESHVALRRDLMPSEWFNDAVSEAAAPAVDSVTLVPPFLTDGTWYVTVYGDAPHTFNLFQGPPSIPVIPYIGATPNPNPLRAGWQHFVVTNIGSQTGTLGWELALSGEVPGTEIALRRNAVPSRWQSRNAFDAALSEPAGPVDYFTRDGLLQRPGHQADVWYVGVFLPGAPLGAFTLTRTEIVPAPVAWNAGTIALGPVPPQQWRFFQFGVPAISGPPGTARGWDLTIAGNTTGDPQMVVCRDQLPEAIYPGGWGTGSSNTTWPSGAVWGSYYDATVRWLDAGDGRYRYLRNHVSGMGRPLEPGRYYVGVRNESTGVPADGSLNSSGIGEGIVAAGVPFTLPVNTLAFAGGSVAVSGLAPRQARYFKVAVPAGVPAWEVTLTASVGESLLLVRRGTVPDHHAGEHGEAGVPVLGNGLEAQIKMQKAGNDRYLMLPPDGTATLPADDYFLAVISEGDAPPDDATTGAGGSDFTLTSVGVPPVTAFPAWGPLVITQPVTAFAAGQFRMFTFNVPAGTTSFSAELTGATGNMVISIVPGTLMPGAIIGSSTYLYGLDGGTTTGASGDDRIINIANPVAGTWSMLVGAAKHNATTSAITLTRGTTPALTFNGGTSAVTAHLPETWRYFTVTVPAAANGWDLRLTNITAGDPALVVRRVLLPQVPQTTFAYPQMNLTWPAGEAWGGMSDWTGRGYDPGGPHPYFARLIMGMGRPLEPGAYFVGVYNQSADTDAAYTLQSRGIGAGLTFPITPLAFSGAGSSLAVPLTAAREVRYFSITIPAGTPRWEFTFTPTNSTDDHVVAVRRGTVPDFAANGGGNLNDPEATDAELLLAKSGPERFIMLPEHGAASLVAGTYFIAVMSEGGNLVDSFTTGATGAGGTLTSLGVPPVTALGVVPAAAAPHALAPGQFRLFNFTVPAGVTSMSVSIAGRAEEQFFAIIPGAALPDLDINAGSAYSYGQDGGEQGPGRLDDTSIITVNSPVAGVWSAIVGAYSLNPAPATGTLTITTQAAPVIAFDGGFQSVSGHEPGAWRYFTVTVPAGALGWDVRIRDITGGLPRMVIRKDLLPEDTFANVFDTSLVWPDDGTMHGTVDWSGRPLQDSGVARYAQRRVTGMGRPLTPGTYIVGVINDDAAVNADYVVESRGIGAGLTLPVTPLALAGGSVAIAGLQPHEARYFSVVVPVGVASWRLNLTPALGEMMMVLRRGTIPGFEAGWSGEAGTPQTDQGYDLQVEMQKDGAETYLMLPPEGATTLVAGTYFIAVISEGVDPQPGLPGIGPVSGTLTSTSPQGIVGLGAVGPVPVPTPIALFAGQSQLFAFNVPAGTALLETRLDERAGDPAAFLAAGTRFPQLALGGGSLFDYGNDGGSYAGVNHQSSRTIISTRLPQAGAHRLVVGSSFAEDSTATLSLRTVAFAPLAFDAALNGAGVVNTASRLLLDGQRAIFQVEVPLDVSGTLVEGWQLSVNELLGNARIRVFQTWGDEGTSVQVPSSNVVILTTPWLERCRFYYIELEGDGLTDVTLTSSMVRPQIPALTMPSGFNNTFGDTGEVDIADSTWHFYAVDVPADNSGLLRTALEAISGNPDLYLREDGVPSTDQAIFGANSGYDRSLTDTVSEYGNWVPTDGRTQPVRLRPGRWWLAVRATGGSNARYRLLLSNGQVTDLPGLNAPAFTAQNLVGGDWRYYRVTMPAGNFATWSRTFSQQLGDVVMHLRDTVPPGSGRYAWGEFHNAAGDAKNTTTWAVNGDDDPGTYTDTTAPLRPGATYFVGFRAKEDSTYTFTSSGFSGPALSASVGFYAGSFSAMLAPGQSQMHRVFAPAVAGRWRHIFTTTSPDLSVTIEQGTLPPSLPGFPHYQWSGDHAYDTEISPAIWPWQPAQTYWVRVTNSVLGPPATFTFTMNGTDDPSRVDTDSDLMADSWEHLHFGNLAAGPLVDDDLDGSSNRVEFAFGSNPADAFSSPTAGIGIPTPPPNARLTYTISVPEIPPAFLRYTVEVSSDMVTWTPVATKAPGAPWTQWTGAGEVFPPVSVAPNLVSITIANCDPIAGNPLQFMRVTVGP